MTKQERLIILEQVKTWFKTVIIPKHIINTQKLSNPKEFDINPFLVPYIATYMTGELTAESVAKALVYPRVFGQSISTSFGQNIQNLISQVFKSYGSMVPGLDIEFIDAIDGRKKYCQIKLGPYTINKDDVETIHNHFRKAKNLGKTNNLPVQQHDLVVGILYGEPGQESSHYKKLRDSHDYTLLTAKDFWHHLTGDLNFYNELKKSIAEVASEAKGVELIEKVVSELSKTDLIKKLAEIS